MVWIMVNSRANLARAHTKTELLDVFDRKSLVKCGAHCVDFKQILPIVEKHWDKPLVAKLVRDIKYMHGTPTANFRSLQIVHAITTNPRFHPTWLEGKQLPESVFNMMVSILTAPTSSSSLAATSVEAGFGKLCEHLSSTHSTPTQKWISAAEMLAAEIGAEISRKSVSALSIKE